MIEQLVGRVITDLLLSGVKTSPDSLKTENEISRLRLKLMAAQSDRRVRELRDAIFVVEQRRLITPEVRILNTKTHDSITLSALQRNLRPLRRFLSTSWMIRHHIA